MRDYGDRRGVELTIASRVGRVGIELAGATIDGVLVDLGEWCGTEMLDDRLKEPLVAAVLQIAHGCAREGSCSATTVDGLGKDLGLAFRFDFFRRPLVTNSRAFFNSDSAEGAADDPVWRFGATDEAEGHGKTS